MLRDTIRLQRHAALIESDLSRTLDGSWSCSVSDEYLMRVVGPTWQGVVDLDNEVDDDDDDDDEGGSGDDTAPGDPEAMLDNDASEAVAEQVAELLGNAQIDWPTCSEHGAQVTVTGTTWTCSDGPHDIVTVGRLGAR